MAAERRGEAALPAILAQVPELRVLVAGPGDPAEITATMTPEAARACEFLGAVTDADKAEFAKKRITEITAEAEIGKVYEGPVTKILDFGALINILPGKDGLLHISQIAHERVEKVTDYLKEGQIVKVKVLETDEKGRVKLSMKALLDRPAREERGERPPRAEREERAVAAESVDAGHQQQ